MYTWGNYLSPKSIVSNNQLLRLEMDQDLTVELQEQVQAAIGNKQRLKITGGNTKFFLDGIKPGEDPVSLKVTGHAGIINYDPHELVLTARAGTRLSDIENALDDAGQMLAFEPPHFGTSATLGGTIACNLSGPRRACAGAARDMVLGVRIINGKGEVLKFGGEVMKNVAGYDVSRLMTGAMGTLGVLLEISVKVAPKAAASATLIHTRSPEQALRDMNTWAGRTFPITASCYHEGNLYIRLEGTESSVNSTIRKLGGQLLSGGTGFWHDIREQQHGFFKSDNTLWRLSVKPTVPMLEDSGPWLFEWFGAQRWFSGKLDAGKIREYAIDSGGHATQFRHPDLSSDVFHPLQTDLMDIHKGLKAAFDPHHIFNPGRLYPDL